MKTRHSIPNIQIRRLTTAAMCLALCLLLPFLTGQLPQIGNALCPMHLPVLLAGFLCGPWWAMAVGAAAPLLRHLLFSMPPLLTATAMSFELAAYGAVSGLLYRKLPHTLWGIYASLVPAMIAGRVLWGIVRLLLTGISGEVFTLSLFLTGAFVSAIPGILVQLVLIPALVTALEKATIAS